MNSKRLAVPMILILTVVGSLSACSSDGATETSAAPDATEPAAQSQGTTSAQTFNMTITGDVQATLTGDDLTQQFFCPDFQGESFDGSSTFTLDTYDINFVFNLGDESRSLTISVFHGAPGTVPVNGTDADVILAYPERGREDAYWAISGQSDPSVNASGDVTVAEDGQSGSLDVQHLVKPTYNDMTHETTGPTVNIQGSWSC